MSSQKKKENAFFHTTKSKLFIFTKKIDFKYKILITILASLIIGVLNLFFVKNTGLYSFGISAITQGISRVITTSIIGSVSQNILLLISSLTFWFLIVLINVPLLIFSYRKIGKKFTILTTIYLIVSSLFSFSLDQIPNISNIQIFGNVNSSLTPESSVNITFLIWSTEENMSNDNMKVISLFVYCISYPIFANPIYAIVYMLGASTAGSDIISMYTFKVKHKELSSVLFIVNLFCLIIGNIMGSYVSIGLITNDWSYTNFFNPNLICSLIMCIIFSSLLHKLYPAYKIVKLTCISDHMNRIDARLDEIQYIHSRTYNKVYGSYYKKEKVQMTAYCFCFEVQDLIREIREIDEFSFISISKDVEIDGRMTYYSLLE